MKKYSKIVKKVFLFGVISIIGVVGVVSTARQINNKKPQNITKTNQNSMNLANGLSDEKSNVKLNNAKENTNNEDGKDAGVTDFDHSVFKEQLAKIKVYVENKQSYSIFRVKNKYIKFENYDDNKYEPLILDVIINQALYSLYITFILVDKETKSESDSKTVVISGFSKVSKEDEILKQIDKITVDYPDRHKITVEKFDQSLVKLSSYPARTYKVELKRAEHDSEISDSVELFYYISAHGDNTMYSFWRTITGFKPLVLTSELNEYAKTLTIDVKNKDYIQLNNQDLYTLDFVSNISNEHKLIIKKLNVSEDKNNLIITYTVSKNDDPLSTESEEETITVSGFKKQ